MTEESLKNNTARGLLIGGVSGFLQQVISLLFGLILARLLTADDYGMVGLLAIFYSIGSAIVEGGFVRAIVNKKDIRDEDYDAVFGFSILTGLLLYALLFFCAPYIALFFKRPELTSLSRLVFLGFIFNSVGVAPSGYLYKNLMVKERAKAVLLALVISNSIGVVLALYGCSYWGIAIQHLLNGALLAWLSFFFSRWKPSFTFRFSRLKPMFRYGFRLLITQIIWVLSNNILSVFLGRYYPVRAVGFYNQADKWYQMSWFFIFNSVKGVSQPVFTLANDDMERQVRMVRKMLRFTSMVGFPLLWGLAMVAPEFITVLITDKWQESAKMLQLLCFGGAWTLVWQVFSELLLSRGRSRLYMWNIVASVFLKLLLVFCVKDYGISVMLASYVSVDVFWGIFWVVFTKKDLDIRLMDMIRDIVPFLLLTVGVLSIAYFSTLWIKNGVFLLLGRIFMASFLYIAMLWKMDVVIFRESVEYLKGFLERVGLRR